MKINRDSYQNVVYGLVIYAIVFDSLFTVPSIEAVEDKSYTFGAHRGNSVNYIENSMEAISAAVNDEKYEFIEFDIQYTKDKKIVVYHDLSLVRLQRQALKIQDLTYEELNQVSKYKIPLYEEVMDLVGNKKWVNIEFKSQSNYEEDKILIDYVVKDLYERGIGNKALLSSISSDVVIYIKEAYPEFKVGKIYWILPSTFFNFDVFTQRLYDEIEAIGADYVMLHGDNLRNYASLIRLKPTGVDLAFWYFNDQMYIIHNEETDKPW